MSRITDAINSISDFIKNINSKQKKYVLYGGIAIIFVIIIFIILNITIFSKITPQEYETKMKNAAINYFQNNDDLLPEEDKGIATISMKKLISEGYLKSTEKSLKDKSLACSGNVIVAKNSDYYLYSPTLKCGKTYQTQKLVSEITKASNIVKEGDGLYLIGDDYIYRGENVNNYIKFANKLWRILRVNGSDNSIRLLQEDIVLEDVVWDDRYNGDDESNSGINEYQVSRIKESVDKASNSKKYLNEKQKALVTTQNVCIGARLDTDTDKTGKIECSLTLNNQVITIPRTDEYLIASLDNNCKTVYDNECSNYNYLVNSEKSYWLITPDKQNSSKVYKVNYSSISSTYASNESNIRFVLNISGNVNFLKGDGTKSNPYKIY